MRTEPISRELTPSVLAEPASDIQMLMHGAWLLAGVAIALAGCTAADEADVYAVPAQSNENVAHATPASTSTSGNVQDLTY